MQNQKGITLIALVITIIVLLILAGVSIAMLAGDNGILTNSTKSKAQNELGTAKDQIALAANEALTDYYADVYATSATGSYDNTDVQEAVIDAVNNVTIVSTVTKTENLTAPSTAGSVKFNLSCNGWYVQGTIDEKGGISWGEFTQTAPTI